MQTNHLALILSIISFSTTIIHNGTNLLPILNNHCCYIKGEERTFLERYMDSLNRGGQFCRYFRGKQHPNIQFQVGPLDIGSIPCVDVVDDWYRFQQMLYSSEKNSHFAKKFCYPTFFCNQKCTVEI